PDHLVDVVHRLDGPPGAPDWRRTVERGVRDCREPLGAYGVGGRRLFDRRHPLVPPLLAVFHHPSSGPRRLSRPLRPLPADDGAPGGAEDHRDRSGRWLPAAAVREPVRGRGAMSTLRSVIGDRPKRREDVRFLTGRGSYLDDLTFEGLTHAVVLRSPHAHAVIKGIHTAR